MRWLLLFCLTPLAGAACLADNLLYGQSRDAAARTIADCAATGVKRLTITLLPSGEPPRNAQGEFALGYGGQGHTDLALPNPAFFQHLDWLVKRVAARGLQLAILPIAPDSTVRTGNPLGNFFDFGRYLGKRYARSKGIVWLRPSQTSPGLPSPVETGIRIFDSLHPIEDAAAKPQASVVPAPRGRSSSQSIFRAAARQSSFDAGHDKHEKPSLWLSAR